MHILILGGAGMIGRKLFDRLAREGGLGSRPITSVDLVDVAAPGPRPAPFAVATEAADISEAAVMRSLIARRPDIIFHLAAIVSGEAEADFDLGYRVNMEGTRHLLEAIRAIGDGYRPRLVFTSSIAVYGAPLPDPIADTHHLTPLTSYGTQKAIGELLLADYGRRGFLEGIGLRLPTICVRPGRPNKAASGFFSGIIREPLNGEEAILPVAETVRHWFASPRSAVGFLMHAATLPMDRIGSGRSLVMPGLAATVGEQIAALGRIAGAAAVKRIRRDSDPAIARMVAGWPSAFSATRAIELGFAAETSFDEIIKVYIEDELGGRVPA